MTFTPFPKIPRLRRNIVVTEKLDGTNAQVVITEDGQIRAGSRNRYVEPGKQDNYGFGGWVQDNKLELGKLGPGVHYGEWWGCGIQRGYGLTDGERRFSLFNTSRWMEAYQARLAGHENEFPSCCHVVPLLGVHTFDTAYVEKVVIDLQEYGSKAAHGYMKPEGVIVFHAASGQLFKRLIENDEQHKGGVQWPSWG